MIQKQFTSLEPKQSLIVPHDVSLPTQLLLWKPNNEAPKCMSNQNFGTFLNYDRLNFSVLKECFVIENDSDYPINITHCTTCLLDTIDIVESLTKKVNTLQKQVDEMRELMDRPFMPGCNASFSDICKTMEKSYPEFGLME